MGRTRFSEMNCGIGQALEAFGDWWSLLIVRDAFFGARGRVARDDPPAAAAHALSASLPQGRAAGAPGRTRAARPLGIAFAGMNGMLGLVLTAGGARGAYQAGVLKRLSEQPALRDRPSPFAIIAGSSAGAINGALLAAGSESFADAAGVAEAALFAPAFRR